MLAFASSGSGAMESAAANLVRPGEPALAVSCGKFGERWAELCDAFGAETIHHQLEWGSKIEPAELDRVLGETPAEVVFVTLSETSTGVVNDIQALAEVAHKHGALLAVDAVSALGAIPVNQDAWNVDVVVAGSQKALMCPPGLAFASVNEAALERAAESPGRRYYFDWEKTVAGQRKDPPDSPFTPAVGLFMALDVALEMILETEGLDNVFERHALLGRATREAAKALELEIFGPEDEGANVVTAIRVPEGVDGGKIPKIMRDRYRITIAGGQNQLKGKIVRIAHCGYFGAFDILTAVGALEMALERAGPRRRARRRRRRRSARVPRGGRTGRHPRVNDNGFRVLVKEKIADSGVDLLREKFDVDVGTDWRGRRARASASATTTRSSSAPPPSSPRT